MIIRLQMSLSVIYFRRGVNCLLNEARHLNETEFDKHLHTPPGQMILLDEQCVNLFGVNSHYCGVCGILLNTTAGYVVSCLINTTARYVVSCLTLLRGMWYLV